MKSTVETETCEFNKKIDSKFISMKMDFFEEIGRMLKIIKKML